MARYSVGREYTARTIHKKFLITKEKITSDTLGLTLPSSRTPAVVDILSIRESCYFCSSCTTKHLYIAYIFIS